jgi:phosphoglycolate phosphatase-like HAD superfamily hydrolase
MAFQDCILALDFDGVVWNSVDECFDTACKAFQSLFQVDCKQLEKPFRAGRWIVRCGGDFYVVLKLALQNPDRDWEKLDKAEFARMRDSDPQSKAFETEFYRVRAERQQNCPEQWAASQRPYAGFVAQFPELKAAFREVVLTTTKDQQSARMLLATAGIEVAIWAREQGTHKGDQIKDICKQRDIAATQILFIDDLLENLEQVAPTGAHGYLADWGYNTPGEQQAARANGFPVIHQDRILKQLEL